MEHIRVYGKLMVLSKSIIREGKVLPDINAQVYLASSSVTKTNKNCQKEFTCCGLYYKCFTIVIYNRNGSGQYYKTRIMIVIDDPSLS